MWQRQLQKFRASLSTDIRVSDTQTESPLIPKTTAVEYRAEHMETINRETLQADFDAFDISEELGFLLEEPLVSLIVIFSFLIQTDIFCLYSAFLSFSHISIKTDLKQGYKMS